MPLDTIYVVLDEVTKDKYREFLAFLRREHPDFINDHSNSEETRVFAANEALSRHLVLTVDSLNADELSSLGNLCIKLIFRDPSTLFFKDYFGVLLNSILHLLFD